MKEEFLYHDLYHEGKKTFLHSSVSPLTCFICKKELNGISITGKVIDGKTVFLCSNHYRPKQYELAYRK
jgi:hypothetical protein